ncbi:hypothetical protein [Pseudomonas sp. 1928-m]|uniref:hypothetical protein n=1 Tax=Pseudomonas sp. 1928-m TaxID=3033804 RepID=UPI0023DFAFDC|nr:hypothetical protein [Pseudomonas sp. 1928-m]MDF3197033.1 hypothetical protein [Pseudomonas sp. 1928-m]
MPVAKFNVGENPPQSVVVDFSWYGLEKVYVNDVIVHHRLSIRPSGIISFQAGLHEVKIDAKYRADDFRTTVLIDGSIFIHDLFPELTKKILSISQSSGFQLLRNIVLWLIILAVFLTGYSHCSGN